METVVGAGRGRRWGLGVLPTGRLPPWAADPASRGHTMGDIPRDTTSAGSGCLSTLFVRGSVYKNGRLARYLAFDKLSLNRRR